MLLQTEVLVIKPEGIQSETLDCWLVGTGRTFRVTIRHIEQNWSTSSAWLRDRHQEIVSLLHLFTPFCPLHASSFTNSYTPWLSCTQRPIHLPPPPFPLRRPAFGAPSLSLFSPPHDSLMFLSDVRLMANAGRWQMDMTSRWFCLSSLITEIQSAMKSELCLVKATQSGDKFIQDIIDFVTENV